MDWTMTVPCPDCPFRREGGIPLTPGRIREVGGMMLHSQGGTFPCHRTVDYTRDNGEDGDDPGQVHCAGALAFALKQGTLPQLARIMARFGDLDCDAVEKAAGPLVWRSLGEWLSSAAAVVRRPGRKAER